MLPPNSSSQFPNVLFFLFSSLPVLCVIVVGVVMAAIHWQRHPRPAMLMLVAMMLLVAGLVGQPFVQTMVLPGRGLSNAQYYQTMLVVNVVFGISRATAFALLLAAVFLDRARGTASATGPDGTPLPPPTRVL